MSEVVDVLRREASNDKTYLSTYFPGQVALYRAGIDGIRLETYTPIEWREVEKQRRKNPQEFRHTLVVRVPPLGIDTNQGLEGKCGGPVLDECPRGNKVVLVAGTDGLYNRSACTGCERRAEIPYL